MRATIKYKIGTLLLLLAVICLSVFLLTYDKKAQERKSIYEKERERLLEQITHYKKELRAKDSVYNRLLEDYDKQPQVEDVIKDFNTRKQNEKNSIRTLSIDSTIRNLTKWLSEENVNRQ